MMRGAPPPAAMRQKQQLRCCAAATPGRRRLRELIHHLGAATSGATAAAADGRGSNGMMVAAVQQQTEAELRVELAAAYRIIEMLGWADGINNHVTVSIPDRPNQYLINSYGMGFSEVTASSLVKVDVDGNVIEPGSVGGHVNLAGFNIHGAIHRHNPAAVCVAHTHEAHCAAVASMGCGFLPGLSQHSLLCGPVSTHPYSATTGPGGPEECDKMAAAMGDSRILLLENHGVIATGSTVAEAIFRLTYVTKAAEIQVATLQSVGLAGAKVVDDPRTLRRMSRGGEHFLSGGVAAAEFAYHKRLVDKRNPGYAR
jgi:ribulose-5-phosphate 4-epimerase/fuculose-1-phosphate aldolase